jgi:hypothetical protein
MGVLGYEAQAQRLRQRIQAFGVEKRQNRGISRCAGQLHRVRARVPRVALIAPPRHPTYAETRNDGI